MLNFLSNMFGAVTNLIQGEKNLKFQAQENAINRAREDTANQRMVADMHKAGLSAFGSNSGGLSTPAATQAPQYATSPVSQAFQTVGSSASSLRDYTLESAKADNTKFVDREKLRIADSQAVADNDLKNAEAEATRLKAEYQTKENASYEEKKASQLELNLAEQKLKTAQEQKTRTDSMLSLNQEKRNEALYQLELDRAHIEIQTKLQSYTHNREMLPILLEIEKNKKTLSDKEIETYMQRLKIEKTKANSQAFRDVCLGLGGLITGVSKVADSVSGFIKPKIGF